MAGRAASGDTGVIESSVRIEFHETGGRVAVATLLCRLDVVRRFAGGDDAIVASAAVTEYLAVVNEAREVEAQRRMTALTHIARGNMRAWLSLNRRIRIYR